MMGEVDEILRRRRQAEIEEAAKGAAISGGLSGMLYGGVGNILSGGRKLSHMLKAAGIGGLVTASAAGGATYLGSQILGAPEAEDPGAYATRGGLGGLLAGGLTGGALGALVGSGKLQKFAKLPFASKLAQKAKEGMGENLVTSKLMEWAKEGGAPASKKGAALLGAILGGTGMAIGSGEGMQVDYLRNQLARERRRKMEELQQAYQV